MAVRKIVTILTLGCFLFSSVCSEPIHAALVRPPAPVPDGSLLSPQTGRITDACILKDGGTGLQRHTVVVTIQDLHCHPEVQRNIAKILSNLDKEFSLKKVYVEGGYGDVDTSWLCNIKDRELKKEITENLVDQGKLTGSEYYSVLANRPHFLKGIEDEALHKANIMRLGRIIESKPRFEQTLKLFDRDLAFMEAKYFSSRNRTFNKLMEKHREGGIPTDKYYRLLGKYVQTINAEPGRCNNVFAIDMADYRNMETYLELSGAAKRLNYKRVSRQMQQFAGMLKARLPYSVYSSLLAKTDNFSKTDELYPCLAGLADEYRLDLSAFPDLRQFFAYVEKSRGINPVQLLGEEKRLVEEIRTGLSENMTEAEISFLADFYACFRDYLLNRLQADDYAYFSGRFDKFRHTWAKYAFEDRFPALNADFDLLNEFYSANCRRNDCFLNSIPELCASSGTDAAAPVSGEPASGLRNLLQQSELVVIVTGGFHTEGLKTLLQERGISYLTITPNVTTDAQPAGELYARLAKHQAAILSNALQLGLASQALTDEKFRFYIEAANRELQGIDFTDKNFNALLDKLREAVGEHKIVSAAFDEKAGRATVTFSNGRTITLTGDTGRNSFEAATGGFNRLVVASAKEAVRQTAAVLSAEIVTAEALIGLVALIHGTGSAYINLMKFAAEHDLPFAVKNSNGYVYELKEDSELRDMVNRKIRGIAAYLPVSAQMTAIVQADRKRRLEDAANGNELVKAALAVDAVRDFLSSTRFKLPESPDAAVPSKNVYFNAASGGNDFLDNKLNAMVIAKVSSNIRDKDLYSPVEAVLQELVPALFAQPDALVSLELQSRSKLKDKPVRVALNALLQRVRPQEPRAAEQQGKFTAAHNDENSPFTDAEIVAKAVQDLVYLLFREYGITSWKTHDVTALIEEMADKEVPARPNAVPDRSRQIRKDMPDRSPVRAAGASHDRNNASPSNGDASSRHEEHYATVFYRDGAGKGYPFDRHLEDMEELSRSQNEGKDISGGISSLKKRIFSDGSLPADKKSLLSTIVDLYFSDKSDNISRSIKLLPELLRGTRYLLLGVPEYHGFIIGKPSRTITIRTPGVRDITVFINTTVAAIGKNWYPKAMSDDDGNIYAFSSDMDEIILLHEVGHSVSKRIRMQKTGLMSERLAQLSELLNPRSNGRDLAAVIEKVRTSEIKLTHDDADEENLKALYEAGKDRIGRTISDPDIDKDTMVNALRGLPPSEIIKLAEKVIYTDGFFANASQAELFIRNVKHAVDTVQMLGTEYLEEQIRSLEGKPPETFTRSDHELLVQYAYIQSLTAVRENNRDEAIRLIKEIVVHYSIIDAGVTEALIDTLNIDGLFNKESRYMLTARLKGKYVPLALGYVLAAVIENIETYSPDMKENSVTTAGNAVGEAVEKIKMMIRSGIFNPAAGVSKEMIEVILAKLEDIEFFASWLDSKMRRDVRLRQLIAEGKVIDFTADGNIVQLTLNEDGKAPAQEKYRQLYQERVKAVFGILDDMRRGQVPAAIETYLDKSIERNRLTEDEQKQLLEKITADDFRIRMVRGAYFVDIDPLTHTDVISHTGLGQHYGPQRGWLSEQEIRILDAEKVVKILIEEALHMVRPGGKHGVDILHDEAFLRNVSVQLREAQIKDHGILQSPGVSVQELLSLLSENIGTSLDAASGAGVNFPFTDTEMAEKEVPARPIKRDYFTVSYVGSAGQGFPFDQQFETLESLSRAKADGQDISGKIAPLRNKLYLPVGKRDLFNRFLDRFFSNDPFDVSTSIRDLRELLEGTGYVFLSIPELRRFILGKPLLEELEIRTVDAGSMKLFVNRTLMMSREGHFKAMADFSGNIHVFTSDLDEINLIHEFSHIISRRIRTDEPGIMSERLAYLSELLTPRYNGKSLAEAFEKVRTLGKGDAYNEAMETNLKALYKAETGREPPVFDDGTADFKTIEDALRGLSPSAIIKLAEKIIYQDAFFDKPGQVERYLRNVKDIVQQVEELVPSMEERIEKEHPGALLKKRYYTAYAQSSRAIRENRRDDAKSLIREMIYDYFAKDAGAAEAELNKLKIDDMFDGKTAGEFPERLKAKDIPLELGYLLAGLIENIDRNAPRNAAFDDRYFGNEDANPTVAAGIMNSRVDEELLYYIEKVFTGFILKNPDFAPGGEAYLKLKEQLGFKRFDIALLDLLQEVRILPIATKNGLYEHDGRFAAAHSGFSGKEAFRRTPAIYPSVNNDGISLFERDEQVVIAVHELVELLFRTYSVTDGGIHDVAMTVHQALSNHLFDSPDRVDKKFEQFKESIARGNSPETAVPGSGSSQESAAVVSYAGVDSGSYPFDKQFKEIDELAETKAAGDDVALQVTAFKSGLQAGGALSGEQIKLFSDFADGYFSDDSGLRTQSIRLLPALLKGTGYTVVGFPGSQSFIIGKFSEQIPVSTAGFGAIELYVNKTFLKIGEDRESGAIVEEPAGNGTPGRIHVFFDYLDESVLMQAIGRFAAKKLGIKDKDRLERVAQLTGLLNSRNNGSDLASALRKMRHPYPGEDPVARNAREANLKALYKAKTGEEMQVLDIDKVTAALRGLKPSVIFALAETVIAGDGLFDDRNDAARFVTNGIFTAGFVRPIGKRYFEILRNSLAKLPAGSLSDQQYASLAYDAYVRASAALWENGDNTRYDAIELVKEMIRAYFGSTFQSALADRLIFLLRIDELFDPQARDRALQIVKSEEVPLSLGYLVAAVIDAVETRTEKTRETFVADLENAGPRELWDQIYAREMYRIPYITFIDQNAHEEPLRRQYTIADGEAAHADYTPGKAVLLRGEGETAGKDAPFRKYADNYDNITRMLDGTAAKIYVDALPDGRQVIKVVLGKRIPGGTSAKILIEEALHMARSDGEHGVNIFHDDEFLKDVHARLKQSHIKDRENLQVQDSSPAEFLTLLADDLRASLDAGIGGPAADAASVDEADNREAVSHIIRYAALDAVLKKARPGDVVYSEMDKAEKDHVRPAGFKVSIKIGNVTTDAAVYTIEGGKVSFYFIDLDGMNEADRGEALRQGAERIERTTGRVAVPEIAGTAVQNDKVIIDHSLDGRQVRYNANGTPVASPYYLGKAGHLRKIKKGEAWAANQTMLTYLDDVETIDAYKETLNAAMSVGNGMMVINPGVIEDIGKIYEQYEVEGKKKILRNYKDKDDFIIKKTAQIARRARLTGNEIFISLLKGSPEELAAMKERYKDTAVAGYVFEENGRLAAYHFATGEVKFIAKIRDYDDVETLGSKIKAAPESAYKMVYSSDLRRLVRGEKGRIRAIDERTALFDLLKPFLLSLYDPSQQLTTQFVENTAFGWDREALPKIEPAEFQGAVDAIEDEKSSVNDILAKMGLGEGVPHPVKTYVLDKLAGDLQGPDKAKELELLQRDFLRAIVRQVLVNEKMQGSVLADVELRDILGRKLYQRLKEKITGTESEISAQEFIRQNNNFSATEFFIRLNAKVRALNAAAGPKAINAIIELAPLGDRGVKIKAQREEQLNAGSIDAILAAA